MRTRFLALALCGAAGCIGVDLGSVPGDVELRGESDPLCTDLANPATTAWPEPADWETGAASALALRARLDLLAAQRMREAEEGTATVQSAAELMELFAAGEPSLADITSAPIGPVIAQALEEFVDVLAQGPVSLVDATGAWSGGEAGGLYGTSARGINEGGIEPRQIVDKALFGGAAFYRHAAALTVEEMNPETIDAIAALWGANASLDPAQELADSAKYTSAMGYFDDAAAALRAARIHATHPECVVERDAAIVRFFRVWERAMFARLAFYMNAASSTVATANDDDAFADALHDLSEGIGLAVGFWGLDDPATGPLAGHVRLIGDAEIEAILGAVGVDLAELGASTTGKLLIERSYAGPIQAVEETLASALDVPSEEVTRWRAGGAG